MTLPVLLTSAMFGAPIYTSEAGSMTALLTACLVNGFNTQSVSSATASGGVVTFNFASAPGFSALDSVTIAGAANAAVNGKRRAQSAAGNQVLVAMPGVPDGAVGGTITMKFAPLGWTRPYSGTNIAAYRQGGSSTTKRYLRVFDDTLGGFNARGYEAMTAISTGTGKFPTDAQEADANGTDFYRNSSGSATPLPWVIVGTPRFFYIMYGVYNSYSGGVGSLMSNDTYSFFFGELADIGKPGDVFAHVIQKRYNEIGAHIARSHNGNIEAEGYAHGAGGQNNLSFGSQYPDPASGGLQLLCGATLRESSPSVAYRGRYPGILCPLQDPLYNNTLAAGQTLSGVEGVNGRILFFTNMSNYTSANGVLLLDEDWGDV